MATPFSRTTRALARDSNRLALMAWAVAGTFLLAWIAWFAWGRVTVSEISRKARLEVLQAPRPVSSVSAGRLSASQLEIGRAVR